MPAARVHRERNDRIIVVGDREFAGAGVDVDGDGIGVQPQAVQRLECRLPERDAERGVAREHLDLVRGDCRRCDRDCELRIHLLHLHAG